MKRQRSSDAAIARQVCDRHHWLASVVLCPHQQKRFLKGAASAHLLHATGLFRLPKPACTQEEQQPASKRQRLHRTTLAAGPTVKQTQQQAAAGTAEVQQLCHEATTGAGVDALCPQGRTALHAAAAAGSADSVRLLLSQGADSYACDDSGTSPLMLAAAGGHAAAVKVLLQSGADPFHVDYGGVNPLMCAARCGSAPCIQLLLDEGVDADYANTDLGDGEHALLLAAECGSVAAVRLLLEARARVNRTDKSGHTALWAAARNGHALVVQLLLSRPGVKHIRSYCERSSTPLEEAQAAHHTTCVALLSTHLQSLHQQQSQQCVAPEHSRRTKQRHLQPPLQPQQQSSSRPSSRAKAGGASAHPVTHEAAPQAAVVH